MIAVEGNYDDVNRLCAELTSERPSWAFVNVNVRTYYAEGSKTLAFEIAEQLGWQAPDHVVVPIGSGSQLTKVAKGFSELGKVGLLPEEPAVRVSGAQAEGCSPVATAFLGGTDAIRPVKPKTIAKSLAIGNPADGWYALDVIRRSGGSCAAVTDSEIVEAIGLLARTEGIFAETAGGVTIATLAKLAASGAIRHDERVVALVTGHGLKTVEALAGAPGSAPTATIAPTLDAFDAALDDHDDERGDPPMSVTVRIPTQLRTLTGGAGEVEVEGSLGRRGAQGPGRRPPGPGRAALRRRRQPAPLRQRLPGRRGRPVPRRPGHARHARADPLHRPCRRRGLTGSGRGSAGTLVRPGSGRGRSGGASPLRPTSKVITY